MKGNKLIAEFMGINLGEYTTYPEESPTQYAVNDLQYHTDWNWLMPVIEKITELCEEPQELDELKHALLCVDIKSVYFIVVEFIKNQNT